MRIKDFLQLGYDMSLPTLDESYHYILQYYPLFFVENNITDFDNFVSELRLYDLLEDIDGKNIKFKNITIEEAANIINYTLENPFAEFQELYTDELFTKLLEETDDNDFLDNFSLNKR